MDISELKDMVAEGAALRRRLRLQPVGGPGDKVFPPTFKGAVYAMEQRRVQARDEPVHCVLLDSVQSQANRMELALQEALDMEKISIPLLERIARARNEDNALGPKEAKNCDLIPRFRLLPLCATGRDRDSDIEGRPS